MKKEEYLAFAKKIKTMCKKRVKEYEDNPCENCAFGLEIAPKNYACCLHEEFPDNWNIE